MACRSTVGENDSAPNGIAIAANKLTLNGGTITATGSTTINANLDHGAVAIDADQKVDGIRPTLVTTGANAPTTSADGTQVILTFSEDIGSVTPSLITIEGNSVALPTSGDNIVGPTVELTLTTALTDSAASLTVALAVGAVTDAVSNDNAALAATPVINAINNAPEFTEGTSTTRSVAENTASGQNIGAPVTATDADTSDTLTYTLGGTDAAAFGIVSASVQLQTSAPLDYETKASYAVTVSVSDGNAGEDSINVTINVTADRAALVALYNATGGADWTNNTNWLSNEALSEWYGVETDEDGRVRELNLNKNGLSGEIPVELGRLTNLLELYLSENELSGTIPVELGNLTNLQFLSLSSNELSGEIPVELGRLTNLLELWLHTNELSGEIPAELGNLTNLEKLYLDENGLSGEIPVELGRLTNLLELYLSENELSGTIPVELGNLTNLQFLSLSSNELSGEIPAQLGDLTTLQSLYLDENGLSGEIPAELGNLTNLEKLYLNKNGLSGEIPAELGNLTNLQLLYLNDNELMTGTIPTALANLAQLQEFDFSNTGLCAPSDAAFQAWLATIDSKGAVCGVVTPTPNGGGGGGPRTSAPEVPRNLTAVGGDGQVVLTWEAPASDGGTAITDYKYRIDGKGRWISIGSTGTTYTVTGLANGTVYIFQVRAVNRIGTSRASNRAEATTLEALDFAHFANGAGISSDFVFVNVSPHMTRPTLYFYDQEGHPMDPESVVDLTGDLEVTEDGGLSIRTEMEPLGELTISTHGRGVLVSGSVKVVSEGPIGGVLRFDLPDIGVAGVGASPPVRDALFPVRQEGGLATAAAIHNLTGSDLAVTCRLMKDGAVLEETQIPLAANGQEARYIEEMFTFTGADRSDFVGSVRCTVPPGEAMFTGVAVELDAGNRIFTTLPVVPVQRAADSQE